ncbi:MAG: branched-chain amino acid ABC transporter permease, partial [Betaproteobacteria bacterium]|nr:branched-chain amino acid ABC transporter permease [Betaproteobacteria bacterium]
MTVSALLLRACVVLLVLAGVGYALPSWMQFMLTMAMANGLVSLGIVLLMRGGVVAFGQGLMSAIGGYAAALVFLNWGVTDAVVLAMLGGFSAMLITAPFAPLLARYRGIFFSMLTLALSMVGYGLLGYPMTENSFQWGAALGLLALAATYVANIVFARSGRSLQSVLGAFAASFVAYQGIMFAVA